MPTFSPFSEITGTSLYSGTGPYTDIGFYNEQLVLTEGHPPEFIDFDIALHTDLETLSGLWKNFEREAVGSIFQSWNWVSCWQKNISGKTLITPLFVTGYKRENKTPLFIWPLQIKTQIKTWNRMKILQWYGQEHNSYNMGLYTPEALSLLRPAALQAIFKRITDFIPELDLIEFSDQPEQWDGSKNPLLSLPYVPAANAFYSIALRDHFEDLFQTVVSGKSRGNIRRHEKKLRAAGHFEIIQGQNADEAKTILEHYFRQKDAQFSEQGISNIFADETLQNFYYDMCCQSEKNEENEESKNGKPVLQCRALKLDGEIQATCIGIAFQKRHYLLMLSMTTGGHRQYAPGRILMRHEIEACCTSGLRAYDMGAGAGQHKAEWADESCPLFDTLIPLTVSGRALAFAIKIKRSLKRMIKNNENLWTLAKTIRRRFRRSTE